MFRQLFSAPGAGRDRNGARAERFSTGDIARRIADDVDLVLGKFAAVFFLRPGAGKGAEFIPIVVIVGEGAEFKEMPDAVVTEFELRAARDVAGEQAEHEMLSRFQSFEQLEHAGKKFSFAAGEFERKQKDVGVEKRGDVFGGGWGFLFFFGVDYDFRIWHFG